MRPDVVITRGDVPEMPLEVILTDSRGNPMDLSGHTQIRFHMRPVRGGSVITGNASAVNFPGGDGRVRYVWQAANTQTVGDYWGEFEVIWGLTGKVVSFPTWPKLLVRVVPEVG
ncbi:MAG: hypothetical protein RMJ43_03285 [Chloroherpetonaceae bacterium]|nr:hypothetical protein [Chloroherpetonaceae bacterium]